MRNFLVIFTLCLTLCMAFKIQKKTKLSSGKKMTFNPLDLTTGIHYENPWTNNKSTAKCRSDELMVQVKGNDDKPQNPNATPIDLFALYEKIDPSTYSGLISRRAYFKSDAIGCFPKASGTTCPTDTPVGNKAVPMALVKDELGNSYCLLVCKGFTDGNCADEAECVIPSGGEAETEEGDDTKFIGICLYPQPAQLSVIDS